MAKKTLEEQIAEHEAAIQKLRDQAAAESVQAATDKRGALDDALKEYNDAAKKTDGRVKIMRLVSDDERGGGRKGNGGGKGGNKAELTEAGRKAFDMLSKSGEFIASKDLAAQIGTTNIGGALATLDAEEYAKIEKKGPARAREYRIKKK